MDNFPSNANTPKYHDSPRDRQEKLATTNKSEQPKVEKIVSGEVIRRKKPLGKRFKETFFGGESRGVWGFILEDVLVPAAKDMLADAVTQGIERKLWGEARSASRRTGARPNVGHVAYNRFGGNTNIPINRRDEPRVRLSHRARASHDFQEIILPTRVEAEAVIDQLFELVSKYEVATVANLYDLLGITGDYTDNKYGWTDLRPAGIERIQGGYLLDLPRPEPLD